ncbi:MAG: DMT family transporter, partial [Acidimicrobiia bacterium]|nr:DMT family transporter [Acidimicrobiia bacterium]
STTATARVIVESLVAGVGFGVFFIMLDLTTADAAPWPVVGARLFSAVVLIGWMLSKRLPVVPIDRTARGLVAVTGIFDTGSNVLFLYALQAGDLTTVSVLSSLYPISTIVLARFVLAERMTRAQLSGSAMALAATVMIAGG